MQMINKILFLDIDGVLNSRQLFLMKDEKEPDGANTPFEADLNFMQSHIDPHNVWNLKYILDQVPDLYVVFSSSWRDAFTMPQFHTILFGHNLNPNRFIGKTPRKLSSSRANEIHMWLQDNSFSGKWCTLDDHPIFDLENPEKCLEIQTDPWLGLTVLDAIKVIKYFKPEFKEPVIHL